MVQINYDIIKAHSGEIKAESKEGEGTTFIIQLPVSSFFSTKLKNMNLALLASHNYTLCSLFSKVLNVEECDATKMGMEL